MNGDAETGPASGICQHVMLPGNFRACNLCPNEICLACSSRTAILCNDCVDASKAYEGTRTEGRRISWREFRMSFKKDAAFVAEVTGDNEPATERPEEAGEPGFWERETAEAAMRMGAGETPNEPGFFQQQAAEALSRMSAWPVEPPAPAEPDYSIPSDEEEDGSESSDGPDSVSESPLEEAQ